MTLVIWRIALNGVVKVLSTAETAIMYSITLHAVAAVLKSHVWDRGRRVVETLCIEFFNSYFNMGFAYPVQFLLYYPCWRRIVGRQH